MCLLEQHIQIYNKLFATLALYGSCVVYDTEVVTFAVEFAAWINEYIYKNARWYFAISDWTTAATAECRLAADRQRSQACQVARHVWYRPFCQSASTFPARPYPASNTIFNENIKLLIWEKLLREYTQKMIFYLRVFHKARFKC